jgi:signal transduction histidine kinase
MTIEQDALELKKLNAEKNKFFSIIAHDLRGPFGGLIGIADLLCDQINQIPDEQTRELIGMLHQSSVQVFDLLNNLLEWSRLQMNAVTFNPQVRLLKPMIDETVAILSENARNKNISINVAIESDLMVSADDNVLKTIVRNLVSNALKFTPKNGSVSVSAFVTDNGMVEIAVKDTGIGMSKDLQKKLFSLDQKVSRPGTEDEASNGLGLILCKDLVEKHGGKIRVESHEKNPGAGLAGGTIFYFTIPFAFSEVKDSNPVNSQAATTTLQNP